MNKEMSGHHKMPWWLIAICLWLFGCIISCAAGQKTSQETPRESTGTLKVSAIAASKTESGETVSLKSADRLVFTSIKQPAPLSVIFYFPDTQIEGTPQGILPDFEFLQDIKVETSPENQNTARMEILLKKDVPYEVKKTDEGLLVSFTKNAADTVGASSAVSSTATTNAPGNASGNASGDAFGKKDATEKTSADTLQKEKSPERPTIRFKSITPKSGSEVWIESEGRIMSYSTFTLDDPPRIVVDVFNLDNKPLSRERIIAIKSDFMKRIRYFGDDEKLRVVIDTHKAFLNHYQAVPINQGLALQIDASTPPPKVEKKTDNNTPTSAVAEKPVETPPVVTPNAKFTGEKIALDFFDTDIRNVFRILGEVSQKNFAVDKDVAGRVSLKLTDPVPWDQVLDLVLKMNQLDKQVVDNVIRIATLTTLKNEESMRREVQQEERKKRLSENLVTEYIQVNYADAEKEVFPHIARFFNKEQAEKEEASRVSYMIQPDATIPGTVSVDTRNNVIIITSVPEMIERAKEIVRRVDRVTPQVMIEARIVEANKTFSRDIGIDWGTAGGISNLDPRAGVGPQRGFDRWQGTYGYDSAISLPIVGPTFGINFAKIIGSPFLLDAQLSAMEANEEGKIISSPRIMTLNNREAEIKQGEEVGYETRDDEGNIVVEFKEVDLVLKVTPQVTLDKRISLDINVVKKEVVGFLQTSNGGSIPEISTKEANTKLLVNDGETIAIGGIAINRIDSTDSGVPWLKDIPILGWLFQKTGTSNDKMELLIFMTPQIHQLEQRMPVNEDSSTNGSKKS